MITSRPDTPLTGELAPFGHLPAFRSNTCALLGPPAAWHHTDFNGLVLPLVWQLPWLSATTQLAVGGERSSPPGQVSSPPLAFWPSRLLRLRPLAKIILLVLHTPLI